MAVEEGLFWARDGERLFYRFETGAPAKQPLILIHGHGEHSGRYLKFFDRLRDLQISIATFDLRGCGRSSGKAAHVERFEDYLSDVSTFLEFLAQKYGLKTPIQLFGHSLGGLIALTWARSNPEQVSKLILSSPLLGLPQESGIRFLTRILNRFVPRFVIRNAVRPPFLTHDPEEVRRYKEDSLIRRRITVRLVHEMVKYFSLLRGREVMVPFPVYILMAEKDLVVRPDATRNFFLRLRAPFKELESFEGYYHEIFNESGQDKVFERLRHYLCKGGS